MKTEKANKLIRTGLFSLGAKKIYADLYHFAIQTKYGELKISLSNSFPRSKILSCYSRFSDVEKAKMYVDCNPYSGKWNWCVETKDYTPESFADLVLSSIRSILPGNLNINPQEWLKELFECENCAECHRGAKSHTAIPFNGNWFARCNPIKRKGKKI